MDNSSGGSSGRPAGAASVSSLVADGFRFAKDKTKGAAAFIDEARSEAACQRLEREHAARFAEQKRGGGAAGGAAGSTGQAAPAAGPRTVSAQLGEAARDALFVAGRATSSAMGAVAAAGDESWERAMSTSATPSGGGGGGAAVSLPFGDEFDDDTWGSRRAQAAPVAADGQLHDVDLGGGTPASSQCIASSRCALGCTTIAEHMSNLERRASPSAAPAAPSPAQGAPPQAGTQEAATTDGAGGAIAEAVGDTMSISKLVWETAREEITGVLAQAEAEQLGPGQFLKQLVSNTKTHVDVLGRVQSDRDGSNTKLARARQRLAWVCALHPRLGAGSRAALVPPTVCRSVGVLIGSEFVRCSVAHTAAGWGVRIDENALVTSTGLGTPADEAGLLAGDFICRIGAEGCASMDVSSSDDVVRGIRELTDACVGTGADGTPGPRHFAVDCTRLVLPRAVDVDANMILFKTEQEASLKYRAELARMPPPEPALPGLLSEEPQGLVALDASDVEDEVKWAESQRDFLRLCLSPAQDLATASVLILTPTGLVPLNDAISDASTEAQPPSDAEGCFAALQLAVKGLLERSQMDSPGSEALERVCRRVVYHLTVKASIQVCLAAKLFPPSMYQPRWIVACSLASQSLRVLTSGFVGAPVSGERPDTKSTPFLMRLASENLLTHELTHEVAFHSVYIPAAVRRAAVVAAAAPSWIPEALEPQDWAWPSDEALALQDNTPAETVTLPSASSVVVAAPFDRQADGQYRQVFKLAGQGTADAQPPEATVQYSDWTGAPPGTGDRDAIAGGERIAPPPIARPGGQPRATPPVVSEATVAPELRLIEMDLTRQAAGFGMEISESGMVKAFRGTRGAAEVAGVELGYLIRRVSGVAVSSDAEVIARLKQLDASTRTVRFSFVRPADLPSNLQPKE